jgi:hypothetical protein
MVMDYLNYPTRLVIKRILFIKVKEWPKKLEQSGTHYQKYILFGAFTQQQDFLSPCWFTTSFPFATFTYVMQDVFSQYTV